MIITQGGYERTEVVATREIEIMVLCRGLVMENSLFQESAVVFEHQLSLGRVTEVGVVHELPALLFQQLLMVGISCIVV